MYTFQILLVVLFETREARTRPRGSPSHRIRLLFPLVPQGPLYHEGREPLHGKPRAQDLVEVLRIAPCRVVSISSPQTPECHDIFLAEGTFEEAVREYKMPRSVTRELGRVLDRADPGDRGVADDPEDSEMCYFPCDKVRRVGKL